jgi:Bifunctional DNA primase/polymerase, N-terminal
MTTPLHSALDWCRRGFHPIPIPHREKGPKILRWQALRITEETAATYFNSAQQNIGVLLGDESGAADVDLDCIEAIEVAAVLLSETGLKFGRPSKRSSHYLYRIDPAVASRRLSDPTELNKDEATIVELRCRKKDGTVGLQTVVPCSVHPSGEPITFEPGFDGHAANIDSDVLNRAVSRVAAASLLARHWPGEQAAGETKRFWRSREY